MFENIYNNNCLLQLHTEYKFCISFGEIRVFIPPLTSFPFFLQLLPHHDISCQLMALNLITSPE